MDRLPRSSSAGATTSSDSTGLLHEIEALNRVLKRSDISDPSAESTPLCLSWHKHKTLRSSSCGSRSTTFPSSRSRPHSGPSEWFEKRKNSQEHVWHSQGYEINEPELSAWLEDNVKFSRLLKGPRDLGRSFWNWRPIRALSHIGQHRLSCVFSVTVHFVEGLAPGMDGLRLRVGWQRKEKSMHTLPSSVFQGRVEFEETLKLQCTIYASKNAGNKVKYMPKSVALLVVAVDANDLVVSKHKLDLSRLLPQDAREIKKAHKTSFRLVGKAKGGSTVVSFGYEILGRHTKLQQNLGAACRSGTMRFLDAAQSTSCLEMECSAQALSSNEFACIGSRKRVLSASLDVGEECNSSGSIIAPLTPRQSQESMDLARETSHEPQSEAAYESSEEENELVVVDRGIETNMSRVAQAEGSTTKGGGCKHLKEAEQVSAAVEHDGLHYAPYSKVDKEMSHVLLSDELSSSEVYSMVCTNEAPGRENEHSRLKSDFVNFDVDEADLIACEFLHALQGLPDISDSDPGSPKTQLLREFEEEMLLEGNDTLNLAPSTSPSIDRPLDAIDGSRGSPFENWKAEEELALIVKVAELELEKVARKMWRGNRARMMEAAETQALMQEWGLSEKVFESSSPKEDLKHDALSLRQPDRSNLLSKSKAEGSFSRAIVRCSLPMILPACSDTLTRIMNHVFQGIYRKVLDEIALDADVHRRTLMKVDYDKTVVALDGKSTEEALAAVKKLLERRQIQFTIVQLGLMDYEVKCRRMW